MKPTEPTTHSKASPIATVRIEAADDPRLAPYTSIREKDLTRGHGGRFIIEGKVTLETMIRRGRFQLESLFLCETRLAALADLLRDRPSDTPVYTAPQALMDSVAGFPMHRGILACGLKSDMPETSELLSGLGDRPQTVLVLAGLSNHDNVGACFRNAAAFGASAVLLDEQSCDPLYRKAIRVSAGASLWLPFAQGGSGKNILSALHDAGFETWAMTPRPAATSLDRMIRPKRLAIVLGAEGPGLSDYIISGATHMVRISMTSDFDSINVATAGAIALSHTYCPK